LPRSEPSATAATGAKQLRNVIEACRSPRDNAHERLAPTCVCKPGFWTRRSASTLRKVTRRQRRTGERRCAAGRECSVRHLHANRPIAKRIAQRRTAVSDHEGRPARRMGKTDERTRSKAASRHAAPTPIGSPCRAVG